MSEFFQVVGITVWCFLWAYLTKLLEEDIRKSGWLKRLIYPRVMPDKLKVILVGIFMFGGWCVGFKAFGL